MGPSTIRNVVLVGHGGAGKTTLAEALLHAAGLTTRMGRIEDGNTVTDFEPEEIERASSVGLAVAPFEWADHKINMVDTPGYADFVGDVRAGLRACDLALFVVSGVDGVEVQTEILWRMAAEEGLARAVFVSKLDRERADYRRTLDQLKQRFGTGIAPVEVPIGAEASLEGVAGIVSNRAFLYDGIDPGGKETEIPEGVRSQVEDVRTALVEAVVESDDDLLERYFEGEEPTDAQLIEGLRAGIGEGTIFPVLCGSATQLIGIDRLADLLVRDAPGPGERSLPALAAGNGFSAAPDGPVVAYVFKTMSDPYVGRISLFRVYSGTLKLDTRLENPARGASGRMHNLFYMRGKEHSDTTEVAMGDLAAVAKLETTVAGDTLRTPGADVQIAPVSMPRPTMAVAVDPKTTHDEEKLSTALARMAEEDPTLTVERRTETKQTVVSGLGDAHLDVVIARLQRRYGVAVDTSTPRVAYRETIRGRAQAEGKHKKQSGGRGQFGVAYVRFEPRERGEGYEFVNEVKGGSIPRQFIPAVGKGIREAFERGVLAGYPVVDVRATVYDGKYHSVDSDELSFRMAGIQAVRNAAREMQPTLLEPIARVTVTVPEAHMGDVIGDLNAKRGRVLGMDSIGMFRIVTAEAPLAEMQRYTIDLRSMTQGRGFFEMEVDHYEEMPPNEAQKVIAAARAEDD